VHRRGVPFLAWDYATGHKPSLISSVNGMITGLVCITPAAGYVNGWEAMIIGGVGGTLVYFALNYLSRMRPFRNVDDTLGVVYTHGFAGLAGGLLVGVLANPNMIVYPGQGSTASISITGLVHGNSSLLKWQAIAALWVIVFSAVGTFILLRIVKLFVPLRLTEKDMEEGDLAVHGHEVYPSDVPSLGFPSGGPGLGRPPGPIPEGA
jgi:Amt family ammonium transporter